MYHSVTAIGREAEKITSALAPSAWAGDGAFWQLVELDARILLLGVTYRACTFFHVIEQLGAGALSPLGRRGNPPARSGRHRAATDELKLLAEAELSRK